MSGTKLGTRGRLIATALQCCWRQSPSPLEMTIEEFDQIAPLLLQSGAGALVWRRIRQTELERSRSAEEFGQSYRLHTLQAAVQKVKIGQLLTALKEASIDPLLVKGWAVARRYPEPGLRPYSDIDLIVRPSQYQTALDLIRKIRISDCTVDLHRGISNMGKLETDTLYDRSQCISLGDVEVRIPAEEDHLRMLCFHMLRHGVWRPLWLCDIAVVIETMSADFDWDMCLSGSRREREWIACSIGLAEGLLSAKVDNLPEEARARQIPRWLVSAVLRNWDRCSGASQREPLLAALMSRIGDPGGLIEEVRFRWDRPIEASLDMNAPFNSIPRLPFQLAATLMRVPQVLAQSFRSKQNR